METVIGETLGLPRGREQLGFTVLGRGIDVDQIVRNQAAWQGEGRSARRACPPVVAVDLAVTKREGTLTVVAPFCSQPEPR